MEVYDMSNQNVRKVYSFLEARWYDFFKEAWNRFVTPEAEKNIQIFLKEYVSEDKSILELGCGTGKNMESIQRLNLSFKNYLGLDLTPEMMNQAISKFKSNNRVTFKHQDITNLDNLDEKYDVIISTWVISHIHLPSEVINKAQNLLKEKGYFYLVFMTKPKWFLSLMMWPFMLLFKLRYVSESEIKKIRNVKEINRYSFSTSILIKNTY